MSGEGSSTPPRQSPYSPFPFGSPLGMSSSRAGDQKNFVSSETTANGTSLSSSTTTSPSQSSAFGNSIYLKGRVRAQEAYGGPVMFGGHTSSNRKSRLISASPYAASALASRKPHQRPIFDELGSASSRRGSSAANTPSPAPSPSPSSTPSDSGVMSSTARLIFDTLEKMSTPVRDAQKLIPSVSCSPPRAEKRRLIAEQFDWSQNSLKRRRPQLGRPTPGVDQSLNGPPLRTIFSPVPASPKPRSKAAKSARMPPSSIPSSPASSSAADTSKTSENLVHTNANSNAFSSLSGVLGFNNMPLHKHNPQKLDHSSTSRQQERKSSLPSKQSAVQTGSQPFNNSMMIGSWDANSSPAAAAAAGGKMRAKVCDPKHITSTPQDMSAINATGLKSADPLQAFLAAHNTAPLPLKELPVFNFATTQSVTTIDKEAKTAAGVSCGGSGQVEAISRASTASTLPLNSSPIRPIEKDLPLLVSRPETAAAAQVVSASASFQFSMPSPASALTGKKSRQIDEDDVAVPNGILFSFCQPAEAASPSLNSGNQNNSALAPPSLLPVTNFTSTSSRSDISLHKNHAALPDLTMRSALAKAPSDGDNGINNSGGAIIPAKSLKRGSVLDVLNRDHSLPDVTASTGIKVANKFSNDNVMMQVRGGHFK